MQELSKEQERALRCVVEQLITSPVSADWAMEKIKGILEGTITMKSEAKLPHEELKKNLNKLEELSNKLSFTLKEVNSLTKEK